MSPPDTVAWRAVLRDSAARLGDAREARWIAEVVSGWTSVELLSRDDEPITVGQMARVDAMVQRRLAGEPLQYVLGSWGFRGLDLAVDRRVLIPRPETEALVDAALVELDSRGAARREVRVLDLGTGSGAIALAIASERVRARVWATDASADALAAAAANLAGLGRSGSRVTLLAGSWYDALPVELAGTFDLIVSNPPYVAATDALPPEVEEWEPAMALRSGRDGLDDLRRIVTGAPVWLAPGGSLVVEHGDGQGGAVEALATLAGLVGPRAVTDLAGRRRGLMARRRA